MFYDEKIETMPVEEVKKLQLAKLKKAVEYAYNNSKFYKNMFDKNGLKPSDIQTLDDIRKIPFTVKTFSSFPSSGVRNKFTLSPATTKS